MAKMWEYKCRGGNKYSPGGWSPSATVHTKDDFLPAHVRQNKEYYSNIYAGPSLPQLATTRYYYMWPHVLRFNLGGRQVAAGRNCGLTQVDFLI